MGDNTIQAIGLADGDQRATIAMYQMFQNQLYKTSETVTPALPVDKAEKPAEKAPEKKSEKAAQGSLPITNSDTFLKFMVDKKTNDITVYIVDRATHKVMRSIPPNDVNNLKAGDLLKLLA